ncbi:hypothetical protein DFJ74DRAFT_676396 [Hyaloraphidium curvatum]|nr:hypothetical protein DFJ74DRAFT_676396 [Hyaloraphidium curvatum]
MAKRKREDGLAAAGHTMSRSESFAEAQLRKFGWKKGSGLGKHGHGIAKAIKVGHKQDTFGLGKDADQWTAQWWDFVFNKTSASIEVGRSEDGQVVFASKKLTKEERHSAQLSLLYRNFVPAKQTGFDPSRLTTDLAYQLADEDDHERYRSKVTDKELFEACGGLTAHKGARAEVVGKLSRVDPAKLLGGRANEGDASSSEDEFEVRARIIAEEMSGKAARKAPKPDVPPRTASPAVSASSAGSSSTEQVIPERWARNRTQISGDARDFEDGANDEEGEAVAASKGRRSKRNETAEERAERKRLRKEAKREKKRSADLEHGFRADGADEAQEATKAEEKREKRRKKKERRE